VYVSVPHIRASSVCFLPSYIYIYIYIIHAFLRRTGYIAHSYTATYMYTHEESIQESDCNIYTACAYIVLITLLLLNKVAVATGNLPLTLQTALVFFNPNGRDAKPEIRPCSFTAGKNPRVPIKMSRSILLIGYIRRFSCVCGVDLEGSYFLLAKCI